MDVHPAAHYLMQVCGSWILFVDGPLASAELRLEATRNSSLGMLQRLSKHHWQYSLVWGATLAAVWPDSCQKLVRGVVFNKQVTCNP